MKKSRILSLVLGGALIATSLAGCKTPADSSDTKPTATAQGSTQTDPSAVSGKITFISHRTDLMNGGWDKYEEKFKEKYPNVDVEFEALKDYEGDIAVRMNSEEYGDVLMIPSKMKDKDLSSFFIPIGSKAELENKYNFVNQRFIDDDLYGISIGGNVTGFVYNKKVFAQAGITSMPKTPEEFLNALKQVKEKTDAIPLYTNYHDSWALNQWEQYRTNIAGDADFVNHVLPHDSEPFASGKPHYIVYKLLYDVVKEGLVEEDPMTTDWESSKSRLANGEIATMPLGSWAVGQIKPFAADPNDVGYMPFPYEKGGKMYTGSSGDYLICINKNSKNIEAAKAWLWWFLDESNYAVNESLIPPRKDAEYPETLKDFQSMGVEMIVDTAAKPEEVGWLDAIDKESEVGLWNENFKKDIVETALGNKGKRTFDDIMNELNKKWSDTRQRLIQEGKIGE